MLPQIYNGLHVKYPLFLLERNENLILSTDLKKKHSNFTKIRPAGAELFRANGHTKERTNEKANCR